MRHFKLLSSMLLTLSFMACSDNEVPTSEIWAGPVIHNKVLVTLQDSEGQDVVASGDYDPDKLRIGYVVDGKEQLLLMPSIEVFTADTNNVYLEEGRTYFYLTISPLNCGMPDYFNPGATDVYGLPAKDEGEFFLTYGSDGPVFGPINFTIEVWKNDFVSDDGIEGSNTIHAITSLSYDGRTMEQKKDMIQGDLMLLTLTVDDSDGDRR